MARVHHRVNDILPHSQGLTVAGRYEHDVRDFNFGTLVRTDARLDYSETNTIFGGFPASVPRTLEPSHSPLSHSHAVLRHRGGLVFLLI